MAHRKVGRDSAVIEVVLVVVILAMIGFIGWYVWHTKQNTDKTFSDTGQSAPVASQPSIKVANFAECEKAKGSITQETYPEKCITKDGQEFVDAQASQQTYVTIKEWGVRAPYRGSFDLSYNIDSQGNARFSAKQLDDIVAGTDVSCKGYAGAITRYSADQHIDADDSQPTAADASANYGLVHIGAYYYMFSHVQAACEGSLPSTISSTKQAQLQTLLTQANDDVKAITAALEPVSN